MGPLETRRSLRTALLGLLAFGVVGLIMYVAGTAHIGLPFVTRTEAKAAFDDVHSLKVGDDVRQNSIRIGKVSAIDYEDGHAVVTMKIDGEKPIYADAKAAILDFSALGTKLVELSPGSPSSGLLGNNTIPAQRNVNSADIYQLYDVFNKPTLDGATSTLRQVGGGAAGRGPDLQAYFKSVPDLLVDLGTVSDSLAAPSSDLPGLLRSARDISARFAERDQHISAAVAQSADTLHALSVDNAQPLSDTLRALPATLDHTRAAFDDLNGPLEATHRFFDDFEPGARALSDAENDLRESLVESPKPLHKVPDVADEAEPAVKDLRHTLSDLRPLAPKVADMFDDLAEPVGVLAPYADDMGKLFVRGHSFMSENVDGVTYARLSVDPAVRTVAGLLLPSGTPQDNYPAPGRADHDRQGLIGGGR